MNVTVVVPQALRPVFDGRRRIELGVPRGADLGDVLQALLVLYPKLAQHLPSERKPVRQHLNLVFSDSRLYLFASNGGPPAPARSPGRGK
ncbi:MAG: hypothetical protein HYZ28_26405 [Myxococcales bacterium]|nr:hypothetical protein [Myxococcales bacterium]